jgi:transposase
MKVYKEAPSLSQLFLGKGVIIYDWKSEEDGIKLFAKSNSFYSICPKCHAASVNYHSTYTRTIQDLPINLNIAKAEVIAYKYYCMNPDCTQKVFCEPLSFASRYQRRTEELNALILASAIFMSNEGTSSIFEKLGIQVSNSSIERLIDHVNIVDNPNVVAIGVDDVAIDTNREYATVIYDLETSDLLAILPGRGKDPLKEWLKRHPNIKAVARDRASAYSAAINEALPDAIQIADRFHLIQNIIKHMGDTLKANFPDSIAFKDEKILEETVNKEWGLKYLPNSKEVQQLNEYDNSIPVNEEGMPVKYDNKNRALNSKQYQEHAKNREKKQSLIIEIKKRYDELEKEIPTPSHRRKKVAQEFGKSPATIKRYIALSFEEIQVLDNPKDYKKRETIFDDYLNIIYKMLKNEIPPALIFSYIVKQGYKGNLNSLADVIRNIARNNFKIILGKNFAYKMRIPENVTVWTRGEVLKYMTTLRSEEKPKQEALYTEAVKAYPVLLELELNYLEFHSIIMGNDRDSLDDYISNQENGLLGKFISGLKKDIAPIKNAISFKESSGMVEGNNNKFKLIKRIGYGRFNLPNLFKKCWLAFKTDSEKFDIRELLNGFTI